MRVLVDTSVWSLALRRDPKAQSREAVELRRLVSMHMVVLIGPVRQELLSGVRSGDQFERLAAHLEAFPDLPVTTEDHVRAAKFFNLCRSKGIQGSNTDFLLCAVAVRHELAILTTDGDFPRFAKILPVVLHELPKVAEPASSRDRRAAPKREG